MTEQISRPQPKPSFESQLQVLPPDVRSVAESLALRDARVGTALRGAVPFS